MFRESTKAVGSEIVESSAMLSDLQTWNNLISHAEETKLDQVLQETQRSRQMSNQIIQRIFPGHPGHGCLQEALPFGEKVTVEKTNLYFVWLVKIFTVLF